jgi:hypothetical protein
MSNHPRRKATSLSLTVVALSAFALTAVACTSAGGSSSPSSSPAPSGAPSNPPSSTPDANTIDHPTGASDVILRYDEGGGFVMASFAATMLPPFSLYGDGMIVFRDPTLEFPPMEGSIGKANPLRTAKLTEAQIQDVLQLALVDGGLAVARPEYRNDLIADAGTAIFTVNAGGLTKTVSVYALGIDPAETGADAPARTAFAKLADSLTSIEKGGAITASDYAPTAYRGVLMEAPGVTDPGVKAWPWADLTPADFAPAADPNGLQFPHHTLTPAEVEAIGVTGYEGGLQNVTLTGPDGKTYTLSVRPLLPDETE